MLITMLLKTTIIILFVSNVKSETCRTPNNEVAQCISLYKCTTLLQSLQSPDPKAIEFVEKSYCGVWTNDPMVCCGIVSDTTKNKLFDERSCGYQHSDDYYRADFTQAALDEYPWLVLFKYDEDFSSERCAGAVINDQYVLTTVQCLEANPLSVRIGEYNVEKPQDCLKDGENVFCADNVQDVEIEERIVHSLYNRELKQNNIGLVRLKHKLVFTDFIRPICLPLKDVYVIKPGDQMFASGFGLKKNEKTFVNVKKKIETTFIPGETCLRDNFKNITKNEFDLYICANEITSSSADLCDGDYGGPLMVFKKTQWYLEGLYSWGPNGCSGSNPKVFTNVVKYLDWIHENVRH